MSAAVEYRSNKATVFEIAEHLWCCDASFVPPLSGRVETDAYAQKLASKSIRFEAWSAGTLVGLLAMYCNDQENRIAYITSVSVLRNWVRQGIAARLMNQCIEHAETSRMQQISLEVASDNASAIRLYESSGFVAAEANAQVVTMNLYLERGEKHE